MSWQLRHFSGSADEFDFFTAFSGEKGRPRGPACGRPIPAARGKIDVQRHATSRKGPARGSTDPPMLSGLGGCSICARTPWQSWHISGNFRRSQFFLKSPEVRVEGARPRLQGPHHCSAAGAGVSFWPELPGNPGNFLALSCDPNFSAVSPEKGSPPSQGPSALLGAFQLPGLRDLEQRSRPAARLRVMFAAVGFASPSPVSRVKFSSFIQSNRVGRDFYFISSCFKCTEIKCKCRQF